MGPKILIADDSQLIQRLAQCFLRTRYRTSTAASGEETFERALTDQPDLILLDKNLRGRTASATLAVLANDARTKHIPVVVMTTEDRAAGLGPEIDQLVKPFDASDLIGKLRERLSPATAHHATSRAADVRPARANRRAA